MRDITRAIAYWFMLAAFAGWGAYHLWINEPLTAALLFFGAYLQWKNVGSDIDDG